MTKRQQLLDAWLQQAVGGKDYQLNALAGDASFRRYFRLVVDEQAFVVMDASIEQEVCGVFVDVCKRFLAAQINVPRVIAMDLQQGFLLLSDLGACLYLDQLLKVGDDRQAVDKLYEFAMQTLLQLQQRADYQGLPLYDEALLVEEMALFRHWFLQRYIGMELTATVDVLLDDVFKILVNEALAQPNVVVHRDYHSRNLMVNDSAPLGVLDFQDAVYGPLTYDLVSLLKDCYIKWPRQRIKSWAASYFERVADDYEMDLETFMRWFDLMGVQRHLKASGIFARLYLRDAKVGYLADIPRTLSYIIDLKPDYPELHGLIELLEKQAMPAMAKM